MEKLKKDAARNECTCNKIGITTYYRYNYGSILQCYATCEILKKYGYQPIVFDTKSTKTKTLEDMVVRCFRHPKYIREFYATWKASRASSLSSISEASLVAMEHFVTYYISVKYKTAADLKVIGSDPSYKAFLSGSDQIWNGHRFLIPPHHFLRFAPERKRIAWAPSLGTSDVAPYNLRIYKKYISQYASLSAREAEGVKVIQDLTGKKPVQLIDPVFLLTRTDWDSLIQENTHGKYALCYFLDKLNEKTVDLISEYCNRNQATPIVFGNISQEYVKLKAHKEIVGGPKEFLSLISHADCLFTDSFHGVSFSIILHTPFFAFSRNYTHGVDQSTRLHSILQLCKMENAFEPTDCGTPSYDFEYADQVIEQKRQEMLNYLTESIEKAKQGG